VIFDPDKILQEKYGEKPDDPWGDIPQAFVLGHELCGHLLPSNCGSAERDTTKNEEHAIEVENKLRAEKGSHSRLRQIRVKQQ
jgi:hypothetical protein